MMRPNSNPQERVEDEEVHEEKDYFAKFEQEPEFRKFVRKLSRCRSIASLDFTKAAEDAAIEDEKGKAEDNIKAKVDYKQTSRHRQHQNKVVESYKHGDLSGRGENHSKVRTI